MKKSTLKKNTTSIRKEGMKKRISKNHLYTAVYEKKGNWYVGYVEEIPGVNTQGKTLAQTKRNLQEALQLILETNRILAASEVHSKKMIREPLAINQ